MPNYVIYNGRATHFERDCTGILADNPNHAASQMVKQDWAIEDGQEFLVGRADAPSKLYKFVAQVWTRTETSLVPVED